MKKYYKLFYGIMAEILAVSVLAIWMLSDRKPVAAGAESSAVQTESSLQEKDQKKEYIKWVDFDVTCEAMNDAYTYDVETYGEKIHLDWIDLLAVLGAEYGGDFGHYQKKDMKEIAEKLLNKEKTMEEYANVNYFSYYREAYGAVLGGMVGKYQIETKEKTWKTYYGLKAFSPIAKGFPYSDYDDFGAARSYGYRRNHLGHDMMGQVGTPIIAVESGKVSALGWNQYGGWRIGIDSFDGLRYYYYAHLRQNRPYAEGLKVGDIVQAGDVIGYLGRTGYSTQENVNNIDEYHLHFGLQLIFDESQREGSNEIWIDCYELVKFLAQHKSETVRNDETKEWKRVYEMKETETEKKRQEEP